MDSKNNTVPPAPVLKLPLANLMNKSKVQPQAEIIAKAVPTVKPTPGQQQEKLQRQICEIFKWSSTLVDHEDLRQKAFQERQALLAGPMTELVCDNKVVRTIPLRLLVAASPIARKEFIAKNELPQFGVAHPALDSALDKLATYLTSAMKVKHSYALAATTLAADLDLIIAAECTGLVQYVQNVQKYWWAILKTKHIMDIGFDNILEIDRRICDFTQDCKLISMFVKRFAEEWYYGEPGDAATHFEYSAEFPKLKAAVKVHFERLDKVHAAREARQAEYRKAKSEQKRAQEEALAKAEFEERLRLARGGRAGGYGM